VRQIKDGSLAKLYDKWFMQPIPPNNVTLNMPANGQHQGRLGQPQRQADGGLRGPSKPK
jgi:glutamate/aspartate transport system substrate-binding protein